MQNLTVNLDERYLNEAIKLGIIKDVSDFFNRALIAYVESKKAEMEKQQVLDGLKEAVDDVKNDRVSDIGTIMGFD